MSNEIPIAFTGNLVEAPALRFTPNGAAVANFRVAVNHRKYDRDQGGQADDGSTFLRCTAWRELAENIAESLTGGMRVTVRGELKQRDFTTKEGEKRSVVEVTAYQVGPDLTWATAKVTKAQRGGGGGFGGQSQGMTTQDAVGAQQSGGGWATDAAGGGFDDYSNPPF